MIVRCAICGIKFESTEYVGYLSDALSNKEHTYCDVCFDDAIEEIKQDGLRNFENMQPEEPDDEDYLLERKYGK